MDADVSPFSVSRRYQLEIKPPMGWSIPNAPVPPGAMRLTVGGLDPALAPASLMVRAIDQVDGVTFESFCMREFESMLVHFPGGRLAEVVGVDFPGQRWIAKQILTPSRGAILTILESDGHFVWFGILMNDATQVAEAPEQYRKLLASFRERPTTAFGAPIDPLPV